jgi:hypothetical protein
VAEPFCQSTFIMRNSASVKVADWLRGKASSSF